VSYLKYDCLALPSKIGLYIAMKKIKLCRMIKQEPGKYKLLKWIGGILGVLILITAGAAIYISATWKPFITEKIKSGVYESSDHLYRINFNELRLNVLTGTATLDSVAPAGYCCLQPIAKTTDRSGAYLPHQARETALNTDRNTDCLF
jgi:hypothetical protein